jgi:N12 class adenine-specific DNA methylase
MDNKIIGIETKNEENSEEIQNNNCKTFNKLIKLQKLIKKESVIKELCKCKK